MKKSDKKGNGMVGGKEGNEGGRKKSLHNG